MSGWSLLLVLTLNLFSLKLLIFLVLMSVLSASTATLLSYHSIIRMRTHEALSVLYKAQSLREGALWLIMASQYLACFVIKSSSQDVVKELMKPEEGYVSNIYGLWKYWSKEDTCNFQTDRRLAIWKSMGRLAYVVHKRTVYELICWRKNSLDLA